jgi:hypothetical protein
MGILKPGTECIIIQGRDFGKKIKIEKVVKNNVFYKLKDKEVHLSIFHVFPI